MKRVFLFLLISSLVSCKISAPTFQNLGQWQITRMTGSEISLTNTAYLYNPNKLDGLKITGINLNLETDGKKLGTIFISDMGFTIPRMADFQIPISFIIQYNDLIGNLPSIMSMVTGKNIDLRCVGDVKVGYLSIGKSIKIDQTVPINLKDIK